MNIIEKFNQGQQGGNMGLYMGDALVNIYRAIKGVQRAKVYGVAAAPKVGKTTLTDVGFVIEPYIDAIKKGIEIEFHYFSYEIDRVTKEFDFMCHFLNREYNIEYYLLPDGITVAGQNYVKLEPDLLMGHILDDKEQLITVDADLQAKMIEVYSKWIIPLFGEFAQNGVQIKKGVIIFHETKENPTGIRNKLLAYAEKNGQFVYEDSVGSGGKVYRRMIGYKPNNPEKFVMIITDHVRKLVLERGFTLKQTVDKYLDYSIEFRNICGFSSVHIIHLNRSISDVKRLQFQDDRIYPTSEDIKDTGNLSEEANYVFTMFNPNDDKYNLSKFFGMKIRDTQKNILYEDLRTVHLVESRHGPYPQHFILSMKGAIKKFVEFKEKK